MNKKQFQETLRKMEPPKHFSAISYKDAFNEGFESAKNEVLFLSCFLDNQEFKNKQPFTSSTPTHYQGTIQPIDLINAQDLNFNLGNVVKYVCRAGKKQGENILSDLEKAKDYLNFEIERVKK